VGFLFLSLPSFCFVGAFWRLVAASGLFVFVGGGYRSARRRCGSLMIRPYQPLLSNSPTLMSSE
jgi:hypothetical protein